MAHPTSALAWRASLSVLLIFFILLPLNALDVVWASDVDIPEPTSTGPMAFMLVDPEDAETGFTLIAPYNQRNVYLVDHDGYQVHTWRSNVFTKGTVLLLEDGTLLRGRSGASGQGDGVHLLDWNGTVLWDYQPPDGYSFHHDIEPLPNGNILINTMVPYTNGEMIEMGRDPEITHNALSAEPILEIKPNGTSGGDVVWMWDPLDHIIQDVDPDKPNYGVVEDHPELIDFNFPPLELPEWTHTNAVSYNAELDQIMITDRNYDEFWVIDHNTTSAEAAGHSGGARGRGGDILYRWGNPEAYGAGDSSDHVLYGPHNAHWIAPGLPGEGNIIVFNNGLSMYLTRPEGRFSSLEEIVPPLNATGCYDLVSGSAYGPSDPVWSYNASPPEDFYAWSMGGVERLPNGHTLACGGSSGYHFEIDTKDEVVWDYKSQGVFQTSRYYPPGLDIAQDLEAIEEVPSTVNLTSFISDLDTDLEDLVIRENSMHITVSGRELRLMYPDGMLTDFFKLTVSDGIFEMARDVRVNITPVNDPPLLAPIEDITATEGSPYSLDLTPLVSDPDTAFSQMSFTVDSPFATVEIGQLRLLYPNGVLTDRFNLTVSDGEMEDRKEVHVTVTPVNDPPTVDRIQDQRGVEDVPWTVDLGIYIRDVDSPIEDIWVVSGSRYASVSGLNLSLLYPDGVTQDVVSLTVGDGELDTSVEFNVTIAPVNDPPVIWSILPLTISEDEPFSLDVGPYMYDIDTPREELTLRVDSPYIEVEGHTLTLLYPDGVLEDEVVVEIGDGELKASTVLVVRVEPVNDPPVVEGIPPLNVSEDEPFSLDVGPCLSDIDTPLEELTLVVDSPFVVVVGHTLILLYPDGVYQDEIAVEVWDGDLHASGTLSIKVEPVNDPPWWTEPSNIAAVEDTEGEFDLGPFVNDIDTPIPDLTVEVDSSHGTMDGHVFKFNYPDGVLTEEVIFTLSDGEFRVALRLEVTVSPVNDAPELYGAQVAPSEGRAGTTFRFTVVFKDIDMGSAAPAVEVVIDGVAFRCTVEEMGTGTYDEGVVFFLEMDLGPGVHSFHFSADDGCGGAGTTEPLSVSVNKMSDPGDDTDPTIIVISSLLIGAVVLVAILLTRRKRPSGPTV